MGNMSYCRFQNTLRDLRDCEEHFGDNDLSTDEERARKQMYDVCKRIVEENEFTFDDNAE